MRASAAFPRWVQQRQCTAVSTACKAEEHAPVQAALLVTRRRCCILQTRLLCPPPPTQLLMLAPLFFTMMTGPAGLLLYLALIRPWFRAGGGASCRGAAGKEE